LNHSKTTYTTVGKQYVLTKCKAEFNKNTKI